MIKVRCFIVEVSIIENAVLEPNSQESQVESPKFYSFFENAFALGALWNLALQLRSTSIIISILGSKIMTMPYCDWCRYYDSMPRNT